ncbi:MAG: hypothetical protein CM15mP58_10720 [Burkholderiaceae bacterium]|nr:MAG: hypothetical protein CM15mP58_10720 [Burkholderiaceae bacterium]
MKYQKVIGQKVEKDIEFIRPVRGVVSMIDDKLINMEVLGLHSSNIDKWPQVSWKKMRSKSNQL